jgi:hypothetical protein
MRTTDDMTQQRQAPLGEPIRPDAEPAEGRWVPVPGAGSHMERNTVTGQWRNTRPAPPPG